jgi:hypothetical protein
LSHARRGSSFTTVTKLTLILVAALAALAAIPATGEAAKLRYHSCDGKKYWLIKGYEHPSAELLRIKMRKSRADGYAPRCLVAEATAAEVLRGAQDGATPPAKVQVYGARWGAGTSKCSYQEKTGYTQVQCVHKGKDANTVRFRLTP